MKVQLLKGSFARLAPIVLLAIVPFHTALAQTAPTLGAAGSYAVLGGSAVTSTGPTVVAGDLGVSPGTSVTGFPPGLVTAGSIHSNDTSAQNAQLANTAAFNSLSQPCNFTLATDLGGLTLVPGVYCFTAASAGLTGTVTLDAGGNLGAVWVFKMASTLTTASNSTVLLINGAQNCNVFWQVGSSATLGVGTTFVGNILASASITLTTGATISGRALASTGAVTMDSNQVTVCAVPSTNPVPPTLGKSFTPATINAGGVSLLTLTLTNPNSTIATLSAPFTDTLPSGVVIAPAPGASNTCTGGAVTAAAGGSSITLTGSSIPINSSCTISVNVTAASGGSYINSLPAGALQTSNGSNIAPDVATLTVNFPVTVISPTLGKAFAPSTITAEGTSTLTITLTNLNSTVATLTAPFTDNLPSGLSTSGSPSTNCGGTASATSSSVTLTGGSIPVGGCTITDVVTASSEGSYTNSLAAGALQTSEGNNAAPAVTTLTVNPIVNAPVPPTLGKAFSPATIGTGGASTLTITLSNPGTTADTMSSPLADTLPSGLVTSGSATTNCSGTPSNTISSVTLTGGLIPAGGSCTVTVNVTAASGGSYINSLPIAALITNNGSNAAPVFATLTVSLPSPVTLGKSFTPATINVGSSSTLTITLSNTNGTAATLTAPLTDSLPSGVVIASPFTFTTTCAGAVKGTAGGSSVVLGVGAVIPANGACTITVPVTAPVAGSYINSMPASSLVTDQGNNAGPAIATLTATNAVVIPPTLKKSFSPSTITVGGISTLTITLTNYDATVATMTAPLVDQLPPGVFIASPLTFSTTCGGSVMATTGGSTVSLTGGAIDAVYDTVNGTCTVAVNVTSSVPSTYTNTLPAGALQTTNGNNTTPATGELTVNAAVVLIPPSLSKSFSPATIDAGGSSTLTVTLTNPNGTSANITGPLTDTLPTGMVASGRASTSCRGGIASDTSSTVTLTAGSIPAHGSCSLQVDVISSTKGPNINTLPIGALVTDEGNSTSATSATLTVITPPTLSKSFTPSTINLGGTSTLTITLTNPNSTVSTLTAPFTDTLPSGMTTSGSASTTCVGTVSTTTSSVSLPVGDSIPANGFCTVTLTVTGATGGSLTNNLRAGSLQTNNGNNATSASATLTVIAPPSLYKVFSPAAVDTGAASTLAIVLVNPNSTVTTLSSALTDTLPTGMVTSGNASTTCSDGSVSTTASSVTLASGASIPADRYCTVTVKVIVAVAGSYTNTLPVGALVTNNGNNSLPAVATLTVNTAPTVSKSFTPSTIPPGGVSILTITLNNPNNTLATITAQLRDTLPTGVVIAPTPNATTTCVGGTVMATAGGSTVTLTGGVIPANGSCTVKVNVTVNSTYINSLPANALHTDKGDSVTPAVATLTIS